MLRLIAPLIALTVLAAPAFAACQGNDLRPAMDMDQQARLAERLDGRPYSTGNHWTAEKDGERLHLIGTVHLQDPRLDAPVARLTPLIESAAMVLVELTTQGRDALTASMAREPGIMILQDTTLPELMTEDDWQLLSSAVTARGVPPFVAAKFQPWYVSMLLSMPACLAQDLATQQGLDFQIETRADAAGVPTRALEDFDAAIRIFGEIPIEVQITMLRAALIAPEGAEDLLETLMAAYAEERHAESWLVTTLLAAGADGVSDTQNDAAEAAFEQRLLTERNIAWIPVIEQALADTDGPVIAAFGAAHLSGENGVLNLLAQKGYRLTRQPF
ncbi:TraB/GumN family protein [Tropicibacter oceani]|uniref:TraB/GumN family protein n=1 Tax=Tropicibacter oceani TaxID=3058420 RepID=A0ABY8QLQ3_9RHOB|nr:TraB/GumN family protein [Tropicibacter oceani]WGW05383.1 TraB/GumN family protein [Tropicibacter oceani]